MNKNKRAQLRRQKKRREQFAEIEELAAHLGITAQGLIRLRASLGKAYRASNLAWVYSELEKENSPSGHKSR